jgi:hypothetical protein
VQAVVATWVQQWGLPDELRVDNGTPWGAAGKDFLPDLALWLVGWDWHVRWNRPRHKQGNAVVERDHGVLQRWVEPHTCGSAGELQARLDYFVTLQRERYPACAGQSRGDTFPALATGGRPAAPRPEGRQWDERRVWAWLGQQVFVRHVDRRGRISLANRAVGVGRAWAGQQVTVRLVMAAGQPVWHIAGRDGQCLRQHAAPELSRERLLALDVTRHRPHRRQRAKARAQHAA